MQRILVVLILFISLTAVHSESHDDAITTEVRTAMNRMAEKWNNHDLLGAVAFFLNSPDTRLVRDGHVYQGWTEIYAHYRDYYAEQPAKNMPQISIREMDIEPLNANTATVFYQYDATTDNGTQYSGATFFIVKKSGPYWRISHGNMSSGRLN